MLPLEIQRIPLHGPTLILQQVLEVGAQVIQPLGAQPTQLLDPPASQLAEAQHIRLVIIRPLQLLGTIQQILLTQNQEVGQLTIRLVDSRLVLEVGFVW